MKKVLNKTQLLIILLLQINVVITAQTISKDNLETQINKGLIKSLTVFKYWLDTSEKFGEKITKKELWHKYYRSYDKKGRMISRIFYDKNEEIEMRNEYTYYDEENSKESIEYNSNGKIEQRWKTFYDENGNYIKEYNLDINNYKMDIINGGVKEVIKTDINYEYNDNGQLTSVIRYNENGSIFAKKKKQYYENGIIKEDHSIFFDREPNSKYANATKTKYNNKGKPIEKYEYNSDGDLEKKYRYEYNSLGNLFESYMYNSDGSLWFDITYDEKENITKKITYDSGSFLSETIYSYEFVYDINGNWIKKTTNEKSKYRNETSVEERIIEYY